MGVRRPLTTGTSCRAQCHCHKCRCKAVSRVEMWLTITDFPRGPGRCDVKGAFLGEGEGKESFRC